MASSPLDPTFGLSGAVLGALDTGSGADLSDASAVAVQADGKILVAGTRGQSINGSPLPNLTVRRLNADGSTDATFGDGGQVVVPGPGGFYGVATAPSNVVVQPDGKIVLAASFFVRPTPDSTGVVSESAVVRLTTSGRLDSDFGTGGEFAIPQSPSDLSSVAVQADGAIVAAGLGPTAGGVKSRFAIFRLTAAGVPDATFNATGEADVPIPESVGPGYGFGGVAISGDGRVVVAASSFFPGPGATAGGSVVARLDGAGTVDASFGTDGMAILPAAVIGRVNVVVVQADGKVVAAGAAPDGSPDGAKLVRLAADGSVDATFRQALPPASTDPSRDARDNLVAVQVGTDGGITVAGSTRTGVDSTFLVERYLPDGAADTGFGTGGRAVFAVTPAAVPGATPIGRNEGLNGLALTGDGKLIVAGTVSTFGSYFYANDARIVGYQSYVARLPLVTTTRSAPNDYDGDGKSDVAAQLEAFGTFAYRSSSGAPDALTPFGTAALGAVLPAPGDYDGDGKTDIAGYLPEFGVLAYRSSSTDRGVIIPFGLPGAGQSIPAPGDYDGNGRTDVAAYLPGLGILAYRPSSGGADVLEPFGIPGDGQSIPAPGDYDGDGKTDPAVYLPSLGVLAYRPSSGGADVITPFGIPGGGQSVPAPGDYDGDGRTDVAAYLPSYGVLGYRPSGGGADVIVPFGLAGPGGSIPTPGDYDGDGKTDVAAYLPSLGLFAIRPSSGGADTIQQFGATGDGQTVPAASIPYAQQSVSASDPVASASPAVHDLALTDDLIPPELARLRRKRGSTS